ncbi:MULTISPECIES: DUF624 domain-containing protein [Microbacterium]|uniref:DUF624 domain-containing protein n=1 Tax=Microbacterium TaxID=33882 RepID=UPI001E2F2681|nr:DUF624 domain-containing protein [Microbacterium nymphoidis]MCD2497916.1 DUF624 domain-containing protein [Microbacterium nymphoidis]
MSGDGGSVGWALRLHAACEWIWFTALINLLWVTFTVAGLIVLGAAPATVTAAALTRRRLRGDRVRVVREFSRGWLTEFTAANVVVGPAQVATALLLLGTTTQMLGSAPAPVVIATGFGFVFAFLLTAVLATLYVNYDLPRSRYLLVASRWLLANLIHGVLLAVAALAIVVASFFLPGLIPVFAVGAWLVVSTALCLGFFAANDRRVAEQDSAPSPQEHGSSSTTPVSPPASSSAPLSATAARAPRAHAGVEPHLSHPASAR